MGKPLTKVDRHGGARRRLPFTVALNGNILPKIARSLRGGPHFRATPPATPVCPVRRYWARGDQHGRRETTLQKLGAAPEIVAVCERARIFSRPPPRPDRFSPNEAMLRSRRAEPAACPQHTRESQLRAWRADPPNFSRPPLRLFPRTDRCRPRLRENTGVQSARRKSFSISSISRRIALWPRSKEGE